MIRRRTFRIRFEIPASHYKDLWICFATGEVLPSLMTIFLLGKNTYLAQLLFYAQVLRAFHD